jgi:hypothetical protein
MFGSVELPTPDTHRCDGIAATITPWVPARAYRANMRGF